jgi:hypothetical protein
MLHQPMRLLVLGERDAWNEHEAGRRRRPGNPERGSPYPGSPISTHENRHLQQALNRFGTV